MTAPMTHKETRGLRESFFRRAARRERRVRADGAGLPGQPVVLEPDPANRRRGAGLDRRWPNGSTATLPWCWPSRFVVMLATGVLAMVD